MAGSSEAQRVSFSPARSRMLSGAGKEENQRAVSTTMDVSRRPNSMAELRRTTTRAAVAAASSAARTAESAKASLRLGAIDLNEEKNADLVIARHLWQDHRLLPPLSTSRNRWERLLNLFMLYTAFIIPMRVAFGHLNETSLVVFEIVMDGAFLLDIFVNFRTATYNDSYELIFEPILIAKLYITSGWFWVDMLAAMPFDYFAWLAPAWALQYRAALQCNRLLRISRLWKSRHSVAKLDQRTITATTWMRMFFDFRALFYFAHIVGCIWWIVGKYEYECIQQILSGFASDGVLPNGNLLAGVNISHALLNIAPDDVFLTLATDACGDGVPWIVRTETTDLPHASLMQQYLTALYWSIATIVRNPWIAPDTLYEKFITMVIVVIGTIIFAIIIGNVNAMVRTYDEASAARRRRLASIRTFIDFHALPASLSSKMLSYAEGDWQMTAGINVDKTVGHLPAAIRSRILMNIHEDLRRECPLFHGLPRECICLLFGALQPQLCLQGEPLIEPGQLLWELFLLRRGSLSIKRGAAESIVGQAAVAIEKKRDKKLGGDTSATHTCATKRRRGGASADALYARVLDKAGQYIGLVHPFQKPPRAPFRVSAIKQCQLLRVTQSTLWQVLSHFGPDVQESFCESLRDHYDVTLAALKLPAYQPDGAAGEHGDGAFHKSFAGSYSVDEMIERRAKGIKGAGAAGVKGVSVLQKQADIAEAQSRVGDLHAQLENCEARSSALLASVATLPTLCADLIRVQQTLQQRGRLPPLPKNSFGSSLTGEADAGSEPGARPRDAQGDMQQSVAPSKPKPGLARQFTKSVGFGGMREGGANDRKSCAARVFGSRSNSGGNPAAPAPSSQSATVTDGQLAAMRWGAQPGAGAELNA